MTELTKKQKKTLELAQKGGRDSDLVILDSIFELEEKFDTVIAELEDRFEKATLEVKTGIPKFKELIEAIQELAKKEIPAPTVNIAETNVDVKAPTVNVAPPNVTVLPSPSQVIPAPIVNIKADGIAAPHPGIEELWKGIEEVKKELEEKIELKTRPVIFGPGKTKIALIDLSSKLDGSTKTFFLGTHFGIVSVQGSSAPFGAFRETTDYNESGKSIVFTSAIDASITLVAGQSLIVKVLR